MNDLILQANRPNGLGLRSLVFDRPLEGHTTPGQFVTAHLEGFDKAFFAIASDPGRPLELLVKQSGDVAEALCALQAGAVVSISAPMGKGFVLPDDDRPLLLLATGSGLSALRPVIREELRQNLPRPIILYYGVLTPDHRSWTAELEAWEAGGIDVRVVLGQADTAWSGSTGFVQHAAAEDGFLRDDLTVLLCGFPDMVNEAKKMWTEAGLDADRLVTNY